MNWTPKTLQTFRQIGDIEADDLFKKIYDEGKIETINEIFRLLATKEDNDITSLLKSPDLIKEFEDYLESLSKLPDWADKAKMRKASSLFHMYSNRMLIILLCKSIPMCYSCAKGAKVLNITGRVNVHDGSMDSITRRLMETAQFIYNVMAIGAFTEYRTGFISIQKVRLMHASIRTYASSSGHWDFDKYDLPINQEDLAGTLYSFSTLMLEGLKQTGIEIEDDQKEAFMHFWKVVGSMMGVHKDLLVDDPKEGEILMDEIIKHQQAPSEDGQKLTASAISFMLSMLKDEKWDEEPARMIRFFVGDVTADLLGVENFGKKQWERKLLKKIFNRQPSEIRVVGRLARITVYFMSHKLVSGLKAMNNTAKHSQFQIPASLSDQTQSLDFPEIPKISKIKDAIAYQKALTDHFKQENNPMGYFAAIYWLVTRSVSEGIDNGRFDDPEMMEKVDVGFANRYFTAINAYFRGEQASGPRQLRFDAAKRTDLIFNHHISIAANAHISFDLGITVADEFTPETVLSFEHDFLEMNNMFIGMYEQMNADIASISKIFDLVMDLNEEAFLAMEKMFMGLARDKAWTNALTLSLAGNNLEKVIVELEKKSVDFGKEMLNPGEPWDKILTKISKREYGTVADRIAIMEQSQLLEDLE
jgi:hypothetical protein